MPSSPHTLRLEVVPDPLKRRFALRCVVDGSELAVMKDSVAADPDDLLWPPDAPPLAASDTPRTVVIGLCSCRVRGCGDVLVEIVRRGELVAWSIPGGLELTFDARAYDAELARAVADRRWESPDRTAVRLVRAALPVERLARDGLAFLWASVHLRPETFTISLVLDENSTNPFQLLIHLPWPAGLSPDDLAARALALLASPAGEWPDVEWSAMIDGGPETPRLAGPGWRPHG